MGKATIISGGTEGNYTIKMDYGKAARDARVVKITARLTEIEQKITDARNEVNTQLIIEAGALADAEAAINDYVAATQAIAPALQAVTYAAQAVQYLSASPTATPEEKTQAQEALTQAEADYKAAQEGPKKAMDVQAKAALALVKEKSATAPLELAFDLLNDEKKELGLEKSRLEGLTLEETMQAWCADYTEDGAGDVATVEIPGENTHVLIAPGAAAHSSADGTLAARELMSPEQAFLNAAILPGWQKFKPTYRRATITALDEDADTASVQFIDDVSSAQKLGINRYPSLDGVPVKYMACDAAAFEVGDKCLVRFKGQDWSFPEVAGFVTNPRPCSPEFVLVSVRPRHTTQWEGSGSYTAFDSVYSTSGNPCGTDGTAFHEATVEVAEKYIWKRLAAVGPVHAPDGMMGWDAEPFTTLTLWEAQQGVYQDGNVSTTERIGHRGFSQSYVVNVSWDQLRITKREWPFFTATMPGRVSAIFEPEPPCTLMDYETAVVHAAVTGIGFDITGMPGVPTPQTVIDTSSISAMAAFLNPSAAPPTIKLTKGTREIEYEYDGLTGNPEYGGALCIKYKRPKPEP